MESFLCAVVYPNCVAGRLIEPCQSFCEGECLIKSCKLCYFIWWRVTVNQISWLEGGGRLMVTQIFSRRVGSKMYLVNDEDLYVHVFLNNFIIFYRI